MPLHTRFSPLTSANFVEMLTLSSVLEPPKFTASNAQLIFSVVKLGDREELSVDRLQEALRQVAAQKHASYDEIAEQIMSRTLKRTEDPGEIEEHIKWAKELMQKGAEEFKLKWEQSRGGKEK